MADNNTFKTISGETVSSPINALFDTFMKKETECIVLDEDTIQWLREAFANEYETNKDLIHLAVACADELRTADVSKEFSQQSLLNFYIKQSIQNQDQDELNQAFPQQCCGYQLAWIIQRLELNDKAQYGVLRKFFYAVPIPPRFSAVPNSVEAIHISSARDIPTLPSIENYEKWKESRKFLRSYQPKPPFIEELEQQSQFNFHLESLKQKLIRNSLYWFVGTVLTAALAVMVTVVLVKLNLFVPIVWLYATMHWHPIITASQLYGLTFLFGSMVTALPNLIGLLINNSLSRVSAKCFPFFASAGPANEDLFDDSQQLIGLTLQRFLMVVGYALVCATSFVVVGIISTAILLKFGSIAPLLGIGLTLGLQAQMSTISGLFLTIVGVSAVLGAAFASVSLLYRGFYQKVIKPFCDKTLIPLYFRQRANQGYKHFARSFFSTTKKLKSEHDAKHTAGNHIEPEHDGKDEVQNAASLTSKEEEVPHGAFFFIKPTTENLAALELKPGEYEINGKSNSVTLTD